MYRFARQPRLDRLSTLSLGLLALAAPAAAQTVTFSISDPGATVLGMDCAGQVITGASLLAPNNTGGQPAWGALGTPCIVIPHVGVGSLQVPGGNPHVEVDALSFGIDDVLTPNARPGSVWFSVDDRAKGRPFPAFNRPSVRSEAPGGDSAPSVFIDTGLPNLPVAPGAALRRNTEVIDGNGLAGLSGYTRAGLGIVEPHKLAAGLVGDDLDAFDAGLRQNLVYFSLDAGFNDPCGNVHWNSAAANGFAPAAILRVNLNAGTPPGVWAQPMWLGLDLAGVGTDDLDALAIWENGNGTYDMPDVPFGWMGGGSDMVLFSVRRGSLVIGQPDSIFGAPIEEGDILIPPIAGGASPFPGIVIAAEALGLSTRRAGFGSLCNAVPIGDDLDALDVLPAAMFDCNGNGNEDVLDILGGIGQDLDHDGILDVCEGGGVGGLQLNPVVGAGHVNLLVP